MRSFGKTCVCVFFNVVSRPLYLSHSHTLTPIPRLNSESQNHYLPNVEYFFVGLSAVALVVGIFINILDACEAKKKNPKARASIDVN